MNMRTRTGSICATNCTARTTHRPSYMYRDQNSTNNYLKRRYMLRHCFRYYMGRFLKSGSLHAKVKLNKARIITIRVGTILVSTVGYLVFTGLTKLKATTAFQESYILKDQLRISGNTCAPKC